MENHSIIPAEGHKDVGKTVFSLLEKSLKDKKELGLPEKIKRNYNLRRSNHWANKNKDLPYVVANLVNSHLNKNVNLLCDNNPIFNVAKIGELSFEQSESVDLIQRTAEHWWQEQEQQALFEDSVLQGELYGITIEHVRFNQELEFGLGEVETVIVDPLYFGVYPVNLKSPREIQKADALFYFYPMSVREIKRRWPETGKKVKPDSEFNNLIEDERREVGGGAHDTEKKMFGAFITLSNSVKQLLSFKFANEDDEEVALVCECWTKDYTMVDYEDPQDKNEEILSIINKPAEDESVPQVNNIKNQSMADGAFGREAESSADSFETKKKIPKYPGYIRRIITCNGGSIVLSDDPNPSINPELEFEKARNSFLYDQYPFYARNSLRDTSNFWGIADSEQLDQLNMEFNKCLSQMILMKDKKARSKIINPMTSGVDNSEFSNVSGVVRPANAMEAQSIRHLTFDGDLNDFATVASMIKEIFFTVAGTFELENANTPGRQVIAYKAISALIEQASTMRKGKIRAYSSLIRERGRCFVSLAQNWYTDIERWIVYEEDGDKKTRAITAEKLQVPAKLTVVTGSTMPVSNVQKREEAISLFQMKAIDQEALLDELNISNRKNIISRMKQGPFGTLVMRLQELGFPKMLCDYLKTLGILDDKNYKRGMEKGEFLPFEEIMNRIMQIMFPQQQDQEGQPAVEGGEQPPTLPEPEDDLGELEKEEKEAKILAERAKVEKERAEYYKVQAEISKIKKDAELVEQKIETEKVEQQVKLEGLKFDREKLNIERKKVISGMVKSSLKPDEGKQSESEGGHTEKGIKSNNE
jgi:hypothetical protein